MTLCCDKSLDFRHALFPGAVSDSVLGFAEDKMSSLQEDMKFNLLEFRPWSMSLVVRIQLTRLRCKSITVLRCFVRHYSLELLSLIIQF